MQASRFHPPQPRNGCSHTSLGPYDGVEVALRWANARSRTARWIKQPSSELNADIEALAAHGRSLARLTNDDGVLERVRGDLRQRQNLATLAEAA